MTSLYDKVKQCAREITGISAEGTQEATGLTASIMTVESEPANGEPFTSSAATFSGDDLGDNGTLQTSITSQGDNAVQVGASVSGTLTQDGTSGIFNNSTKFSVVGGEGGSLTISPQTINGGEFIEDMGYGNPAQAMGAGLAGCITKHALAP